MYNENNEKNKENWRFTHNPNGKQWKTKILAGWLALAALLAAWLAGRLRLWLGWLGGWSHYGSVALVAMWLQTEVCLWYYYDISMRLPWANDGDITAPSRQATTQRSIIWFKCEFLVLLIWLNMIYPNPIITTQHGHVASNLGVSMKLLWYYYDISMGLPWANDGDITAPGRQVTTRRSIIWFTCEFLMLLIWLNMIYPNPIITTQHCHVASNPGVSMKLLWYFYDISMWKWKGSHPARPTSDDTSMEIKRTYNEINKHSPKCKENNQNLIFDIFDRGPSSQTQLSLHNDRFAQRFVLIFDRGSSSQAQLSLHNVAMYVASNRGVSMILLWYFYDISMRKWKGSHPARPTGGDTNIKIELTYNEINRHNNQM